MDFLKDTDRSLLAIMAIALVYIFLISDVTKEFKQLPSPIFGGDLYYQLGQIYHMYSSPIFDWAKTSNGIGTKPAYFIVYGSLVTIFGRLFSLDPFSAMLDFNFILPVASLLLFYFIFRKAFGDGWLAVMAAVLAVSFTNFPVFKYTEFTKLVVYPAFLLCAYMFFKKQDKRNAILLGVGYGVMALSHATAFVFSTLLVGLIIAYYLYKDHSEKKLALTKEYLMEKKYFLLAAVLGFFIAQIYWFEPIFVSHGSSQLKSHIWSFLPQQIFIAPDIITQLFFDTSSYLAMARCLFTLAGLYALLRTDAGKSDEGKFFSFVFVLLLLLIFSAYVTMPLFEFHVAPGYMNDMYLYSTQAIIAMFGFVFIVEKLKHRHKDAKTALYLIFALLLLQHAANAHQNWLKGEYVAFAKRDSFPGYSGLQSYLVQNSSADDVILSSNELSFMLNAISGRKLVVSRRAQNDVFTSDFDQRELDAAIIFYGNSLEKKIQVMKKYKVKYVYFDVYWFTTDFNFDQGGAVVGYSDPFLLFYSAEKEKALQENGIKYIKINGYVDPAVRAAGVKTYDLLLVSPENYEYTGKGVWQNGIDGMLEPVWSYQENGQAMNILYKVNYPN